MIRRIAGWTLLLVVSLLTVAGCSRSPEAQKTRYLERGDKYFARKDYLEAIIEYQNALRIELTNLHATDRAGVAYYELGDLARAIPYLLKSQELDPNNLDVRLKLGNIRLLAQQPDQARDAAIRRLEAVRASFGDRARPHVALATLYLQKADPASAERVLKEAVGKNPKSAEARFALGDFYRSQGDVAQAERDYKAAAALAPVASTEQIKLADFYLGLQKP